MNDAILETRILRREFGALVAVDDVSMQSRGTIAALDHRPNGAGKTTFFNLVSGTIRPTSGQVIFKGEDITHLPAYQHIHRGMGRSFQITNIFPNVTVFENVRLAAQALGKDNFKLFKSWKLFPDVNDRAMEVLDLVGLKDKAAARQRAAPR